MNDQTRKTGAALLVDALIEEGVELIFGYPGAAVLSIYDELYHRRDRIQHILVSHEQHAAHAADGYARASGSVGVCLATSGPGTTNLMTGIATAFMDSVPLVAITGNVCTTLLGKDSFQEVDSTGITIPIVKHSWLVKDGADLAFIVREAFVVSRTGRAGPVLIDIPSDVLEDYYAVKSVPHCRLKKLSKTMTVHDTALKQAAQALCTAQKPVIYAGGGVVSADAGADLLSLAERLNAPVTLSLMGIASFPSRHPLCVGLIGAYGTDYAATAIRQADLILALGARFSERVTGNDPEGFIHGATVVHCDIDPAEINKTVRATLALVGDLKETLPRLLALLPPARDKPPPVSVPSVPRSPALSPQYIMATAAAALGPDALIVTDVGRHQLWTAQFYPFTGRARSFLTSGGMGTMGFGLGAALGSAFACPDRPVVLITGDGSFRMNCSELSTLVAYHVPVLILLLNDHALGMIKQWQFIRYEGRYSESILNRPPDFVKLAEAYGITGFQAATAPSFTAALEDANKLLSEHKSALIEVLTSAEPEIHRNL
ncbi:MAG: biosynthetic-type acetolactate synthase large subunit [Spirochaetaceae bacterium]|jgi:acetolactate synthase-1/2/3 large subunit|nr:biosynthetic-type acetolactate synthase large subunit [Spirochaetaceae bacterium]